MTECELTLVDIAKTYFACALEVLNGMRYINPRFTYLLTYCRVFLAVMRSEAFASDSFWTIFKTSTRDISAITTSNR